jgi:hypothetical protein
MLLLASRILEHELSDESRLGLLGKLRERDFAPLIRSMRLKFYEQMLSDKNQVEEMERVVAALINSEQQGEYVQGDLFFFADHLLFLLFGATGYGSKGMRAGVVYEPQTPEPLRKLNSFCQTITLCLANADGQADESQETGETRMTMWRQDPSSVHRGFMRFVAMQDPDSLSTIACRENSRERVRAAKMLEDDYARLFLRRAREAYREGYSVNPAVNETATPSEFTVNRLLETGLLRQELLVSCRKTGHTLFNLPSADALAVVTISHATCSICGAKIADEKIEEVLMPTQLSFVLLEDAAWLVNRLHTIFRELGISESEIAIEPPAGDGEARLMARVCGESFLVVMRDGDLTPAFARRAVNIKIEMEARHLVVVVTGAIHNEGRMRLLQFAKELERGGNDFEMIIAEGVVAAEAELGRAFERVSQRALTEQFCELDSSLGLNVAHFIKTRFQMLRDAGGTDHPALLPAPAEHVPPTRLLN